MLAALAIPLLFGGLGALLAGGMGDFEQLAKPPLTPPGWVFPLVWTLLYLAMGWASGRVYLIRHPVQVRRRALKLYAVQLVMNGALLGECSVAGYPHAAGSHDGRGLRQT